MNRETKVDHPILRLIKNEKRNKDEHNKIRFNHEHINNILKTYRGIFEKTEKESKCEIKAMAHTITSAQFALAIILKNFGISKEHMIRSVSNAYDSLKD